MYVSPQKWCDCMQENSINVHGSAEAQRTAQCIASLQCTECVRLYRGLTQWLSQYPACLVTIEHRCQGKTAEVVKESFGAVLCCNISDPVAIEHVAS